MALNNTEIQELETHFGTTEGKTMDDYFTYLNNVLNIGVDELKAQFKSYYPDVTDWSF